MLNLLGQPFTWIELLAFLTGLASVWLTKRMHLWSWPIGLVNVACFAVLFLDARLYADALLQVAFAVLGLYGWWLWARASTVTPREERLAVTRASAPEAFLSLGGSALLVLAGSRVLQQFTDSPAPLADTSILVLSLLATAAQALRRLESWWLWIVVDLISIPLYWSRALPLTAVLYIIFLFICLAGLREWNGRWRSAQAVAA